MKEKIAAGILSMAIAGCSPVSFERPTPRPDNPDCAHLEIASGNADYSKGYIVYNGLPKTFVEIFEMRTKEIVLLEIMSQAQIGQRVDLKHRPVSVLFGNDNSVRVEVCEDNSIPV